MIQIVVVLSLIPGDLPRKAVIKELEMVHHSLGAETQVWVSDHAERWYQEYMLDSGVYESVYYHLIPTEAEKAKSRGMENMGEFWFNWLEGRLKVIALMIYHFMVRFAILMIWSPYMLLLLIPALYGGVMDRKIKQSNFDYSSPIIHRYAVRFTGWIILLSILLMLAPIAIPPLYMAFTMMLLSILIGMAIGNTQKRI